MTKPTEDQLILVDLTDHCIGSAPKLTAHEKRLLHRAFSVFLIDGDRMLIHQRNKDKYHSGGLWTNACCSHPRYGEELTDSVHRRMRQELGIDTEVKELFHFVYYRDYGSLAEYEYDHVFLGHLPSDRPIPYDPDEIMDLRWITLAELEQEMTGHPEHFSAWFMTAAPGVLEYLKDHLTTE